MDEKKEEEARWMARFRSRWIAHPWEDPIYVPYQAEKTSLSLLVQGALDIQRAPSLSLALPWWRRPVRWIMTEILLWDTWNAVMDQIDRMEAIDLEWTSEVRNDFLRRWNNPEGPEADQTLPYYP